MCVIREREEAALETGMKRPTAHDEPGALGLGVVGDERGEFCHRGATTEGTVLTAGGLLELLGAHCIGDGRRELGVLSGGHEEAHVALPTGGKEPGRTTRRIGTDEELPFDGVGVATHLVAGGDRLGELCDRLVEEGDVNVHRVGPGVIRTQDPRKRLTGGVREAKHRMEAVAALEVGSGLFLSLRVDLDERGVAVEEGPEDRRVRGHRAEGGGLETQMLDVGIGLPAPGEHLRLLGEHLAPVVVRHPLATGRDRCGQRVAESETVGTGTQRVAPDMGDHLRAAGFHLHHHGAVADQLSRPRKPSRRRSLHKCWATARNDLGRSAQPMRLGDRDTHGSLPDRQTERADASAGSCLENGAAGASPTAGCPPAVSPAQRYELRGGRQQWSARRFILQDPLGRASYCERPNGSHAALRVGGPKCPSTNEHDLPHNYMRIA